MFNLRMPDVNLVVIAGNLTRDPVFRKTTNGTPVTNFWIASNRKFKDNNGQWRENVCFVGVVAWYKLAESCAENLRRGSVIIVEGELQSRSIKTDEGRNRNIVEIKARRIQFLNKIENISETQYAEENIIEDKSSEKSDNEQKDSSTRSTVESSEEMSDSDEITDENAPLNGEYDFGYQDLQI